MVRRSDDDVNQSQVDEIWESYRDTEGAHSPADQAGVTSASNPVARTQQMDAQSEIQGAAWD
eukprot:COSAG01_NODE_40402_length_464_cov_0.821918_1_plen_62_part_00